MDNTYTLYQGDCLDILPTLEADSVDTVITDIPYGAITGTDRIHKRERGKTRGMRKLSKANADSINFDIIELSKLLDNISRQWIYVFAGDNTGNIRSFFSDRDCMTRLGVWRKTNPSPMHGQYIWMPSLEPCAIIRKHKARFNRFCSQPVWEYPSGKSKVHPTEKPLGLMIEIVLSSTSKGDIVIDPFMGSGATGVACMKTGRNFIGIELDPDYFRIAEQRIKNAAGDFVRTDKERETGQLALFAG